MFASFFYSLFILPFFTFSSVWNDLIEISGLYPYVSSTDIKNSGLLRYEYHKSKYLKDIYFHEVQQEISIALLSGQSVVLSAPTSFGKSLLIEEIIASNKFANIAVIQPTLALLDETSGGRIK